MSEEFDHQCIHGESIYSPCEECSEYMNQLSTDKDLHSKLVQLSNDNADLRKELAGLRTDRKKLAKEFALWAGAYEFHADECGDQRVLKLTIVDVRQWLETRW